MDSSPDKRVAGLKLLAKLARSDLAQKDECELLDVFQQRVLDSLLPSEEHRPPAPDEEEGTRHD